MRFCRRLGCLKVQGLEISVSLGASRFADAGGFSPGTVSALGCGISGSGFRVRGASFRPNLNHQPWHADDGVKGAGHRAWHEALCLLY